MNYFYEPIYTELPEEAYARALHRMRKRQAATVAHHQTCPCCGAKLVNLYRREKEWKCRRCWEKHDGRADHGKE